MFSVTTIRSLPSTTTSTPQLLFQQQRVHPSIRIKLILTIETLVHDNKAVTTANQSCPVKTNPFNNTLASSSVSTKYIGWSKRKEIRPKQTPQYQSQRS